ncbi:hypothetical protein BDP27DRAFT_1422752 [Rhodocollybia butyracea]|uniref:F-box domain-containing protein n=1 Tax=Rhodocollybia butyracea TaxID=206335 RepID=A0A9P5PQG2_9AGAR|nr:hypothetical protein BDP27DRAFT_1422752 [Rhodocollybia butyracea]
MSKVPPELYYEILKHYPVKQQEITLLWTTGRQVSRHFKSAVEQVFQERHLARTSYLEIRNADANFVSGSFKFSHIDENNPTPAVFMDKECTDQDRPEMAEQLKNAFEYQNDPREWNFYKPRILIHVRHEVNDTPLLGSEPDWNNLVIRFDWKQTFSAFFREDKEFRRRLGAWVDAQKADIFEMMAKIDIDNGDDMEDYSTIFHLFGDSYYDKMRREVRVKRICKIIWDLFGIKWTREPLPHSDVGYQILKQARDLAFNAKYSDDGGNGEEEAD